MTVGSISVLNKLIRLTKDTEEGYLTAAENVDDSYLQKLLKERAENCHIAAMDLQRKVKEMDGVPTENGTFRGTMHRSWVNIKGTLTGKDELTILDECEKGEAMIEEAYEKFLKADISEEIRPLIQQQYESIVNDHNIMRDLMDKYGANQ
ncbi:ferritin-like domain-containing protein [Candidatus Odyssella acanthamoebae]|uniref:Aldehyde dehydrogenase n=1 Tax=Candidatus Odyssella acanthamoebae TaxID=91604 RepID=A0A077B026_9PROT|nr:PA2169 family four-helix-bundle protein [Candidatus Paracaedibacter acanthamoebae]AIK97308.1 aldehyde dehydrogenase [Candidatus Paracaedibacter acanthamoebae]